MICDFVTGESEHNFHSYAKETASIVSGDSNYGKKAIREGVVVASNEESQEHSTKENELKGESMPANNDNAAVANSQLSYSTTGYMQYDPSMMSHSHNYSYMAANNYTTHDYVSLYHSSQRMAARTYANAYAPYQGYNHYPYATANMQQMYDGRNMTPYTTSSNYAQQMLPQNPPLPSAHPVVSNNFNPPLPADYNVSPFLTADSAPALKDKEKDSRIDINTSLNDGLSESSILTSRNIVNDEKEESGDISSKTSHDANLASGLSEKCQDNVEKVAPPFPRSHVNHSAHSEDVNR